MISNSVVNDENCSGAVCDPNLARAYDLRSRSQRLSTGAPAASLNDSVLRLAISKPKQTESKKIEIAVT